MQKVLRAVRALDVALRVAGRAYAEPEFGAYEPYQLATVGEAVVRPNELSLPSRRVSSKGKHIADSLIPEPAQDRRDLFAAVAHAGEMSHRFDADLVLYPAHQLYGALARAA